MDWSKFFTIAGGVIVSAVGLGFARKMIKDGGLPAVPGTTPKAPELPPIKFVPAKWFTPTPAGQKRDIKWIVIHDAEFPETLTGAEAVAAYFQNPMLPIGPAGPDGKPTMKVVKTSAHYCLTPETRVLTGDCRWVPIGSMERGDALMSVEEEPVITSGRRLVTTNITALKRRTAPCIRMHLSDGRTITSSTDHRWLSRFEGSGRWEWRAVEDLKDGYRVCAPLAPWGSVPDRDAGYMEGIFDGEGCWTSSSELSFSQKRGYVLSKALSIMDTAGISYRTHHRPDTGVTIVSLSGLQSNLQAAGQFGPRRLLMEPRWDGKALWSRSYPTDVFVVGLEPAGELEVVSIETGSHTFFAEGVVSHNCVDGDSATQSVKDNDVAYAAPPANDNGLHFELVGYAKQSPADWDDAYSRAELDLAAKIIAAKCIEHNIPVVGFLTPEQLLADKRGITSHWNVSKAWKRSDHQDPGPNFPYDKFIALIQQYAGVA